MGSVEVYDWAMRLLPRFRRSPIDAVRPAVIVCLCVLTACGNTDVSTRDASEASLAGTSWILDSYASTAGDTVDAVANSAATLEFDRDDQISGSTGCNRFGGGYSEDGGDLTLRLGAVTQRACEEPEVNAQEQAVLTGLPDVEKWSIEKTTLTLSGSSGKALFTYSSVPSGLSGTAWTARGVNNGVGGVETTSLTEALTLQFGTDGALTGFGGCNNFSGEYVSPGPPDLTISGIASTKKACAEDVTKLETEYLTALGNTANYKREGTTLNLRDSSGATQANFELDTAG